MICDYMNLEVCGLRRDIGDNKTANLFIYGASFTFQGMILGAKSAHYYYY